MIRRLLPSLLLLLLFEAPLPGQAFDPIDVRTIDGTLNNPLNPDWGAAGTNLLRRFGVDYADGVSEPTGAGRPHPRRVSNALFAQNGLINDPLGLSDFCWVFGQFIDHDVGLTPDGPESITMLVPAPDPHFDPLGMGQAIIPMHRNIFDPATGTGLDNPRQHPNILTAFIDGSAVYGSEDSHAAWLRTFEGGKLKTSNGNLLPWNTTDGEYGSPVDPNAPHMDDAVGFAPRLFVAGDPRVNENPLLAGFHTLFVREHNRQCERLAKAHPDWSDEDLYQYARKIVGGLIQSIVYDEWLPTMGIELEPYTGYRIEVNPQLSNVFTAAAFRVGHTLLNGNIRRLNSEGNVIPEGNAALRDIFFNPDAVRLIGLDPFFWGMAEQTQQGMDAKVVDDVRNFLFGPPGLGGLDLPAININRGRERGIPSFQKIREVLGLPRYTFHGEINPSPAVFGNLQLLYLDISEIDAWVGLMAEKPVPGALFGETLLRVMEDQFTALRDGDRFFYLNDPVLTDADKEWIQRATFRDVIMYNTGIKLMQDNVFLSVPHEEICNNMTLDIFGTVRLHNGRTVPGVALQVGMDETAATMITVADGGYSFPDLPYCDMQVLEAAKEDDWRRGISTFDIIQTQKHILQVQRLESPYQIIAADLDGNGNVTTLDLLRMRRLILNLMTDVETTGSPWRFIPAGYEFVDPANPLDEPFPTLLDFSTTPVTTFNDGFIAVKLGDVNASVQFDQLQDTPVAAGRSNEAPWLELQSEDRLLAAGVETEITLTAAAQRHLSGFQFSLVGDGLEILAVTGPENSYSLGTTDGVVRVSYSDPAGWIGTDSLLRLRVKATRTGYLSSLLQTADRLLRNEAYSQDMERGLVALNFTAVDAPVTDVTPVELTAEARPNPFREQTTLEFGLRKAGTTVLRIFDLQGREVLRREAEVATGQHQWTIERSALSYLPTGALIYRLETTDGSYTGRLIPVLPKRR